MFPGVVPSDPLAQVSWLTRVGEARMPPALALEAVAVTRLLTPPTILDASPSDWLPTPPMATDWVPTFVSAISPPVVVASMGAEMLKVVLPAANTGTDATVIPVGAAANLGVIGRMATGSPFVKSVVASTPAMVTSVPPAGMVNTNGPVPAFAPSPIPTDPSPVADPT